MRYVGLRRPPLSASLESCSAVPAIYHFTDICNLERILADGELRAHRSADRVVDIGDATIKSRRMRVVVTCGPGGKVCDYVPFYFAPRSPMLFRIQHDGVDGVSSDPARLVYFVSSTDAVLNAGLRCVFTNGNAATAITDFHDEPDRLDEVVDWPLMRARYWANTDDDGDRVRRRQAEFLVHEAVRLDLIDHLAVYHAQAAVAVGGLTGATSRQTRVRVRRGWYF